MRVALASVKILDNDIGFNFLQMERYMKKAKQNGAELVCFGEAFLQGFNALSWQYDVDAKIALNIDSKVFSSIAMLTKQLGVDVLFGYNEIAENSLYSSCALIADGKLIHNYRRISKGWKDYARTDEHYKEGIAVEIFEYKGKKVLVGLCGDIWEYPDKFALGEDILLWPVYVSWTKEEWENGGKLEYAEQARLCCKNVLYVNSICDGDAIGGAVYFVDGKIQKELPIFQEGLLYIDL